MIEVFGAADRSFTIPAPRPLAYEFYSSMPRLVPFLPRIEMVSEGVDNTYRVAYRSLELNTYSVFIPCDLRVELDQSQAVLKIDHVETEQFPKVEQYANLTSAVAQGKFRIRSLFYDDGPHQTRVEYSLGLSSVMPKPLGLLFVPASLMANIVERIVNMRINEIVDEFIKRSTAAYPQWEREHTNP